jgi:hypothetical protein
MENPATPSATHMKKEFEETSDMELLLRIWTSASYSAQNMLKIALSTELLLEKGSGFWMLLV